MIDSVLCPVLKFDEKGKPLRVYKKAKFLKGGLANGMARIKWWGGKTEVVAEEILREAK